MTIIYYYYFYYYYYHHHYYHYFLQVGTRLIVSRHNMANNSQIGSSSYDPLGRSSSEIGLEVFLSILICLISILDNSLVVYVVNNDSKLKSVTSTFIHNLALTDISMASLHMPFWIISLCKGTWIFSEKWCEISATILFTCGLASILTMGLIAVNRYIRVVKPALYNRLFPSKRIARVYCALVWIASMLLATPPMYGFGKMAYNPLFAICSFAWKAEHILYIILVVGVVINGTTVLIFYCYYKIYKTLKESTQNLNAHSIEDGAALSESPRTDIKLLKTSFTIVCIFLMIWGPVTGVVIVESAGIFIPREISMPVIYLVFIGSLVNPIIYGIMNPQFQAAFKRALRFSR